MPPQLDRPGGDPRIRRKSSGPRAAPKVRPPLPNRRRKGRLRQKRRRPRAPRAQDRVEKASLRQKRRPEWRLIALRLRRTLELRRREPQSQGRVVKAGRASTAFSKRTIGSERLGTQWVAWPMSRRKGQFAPKGAADRPKVALKRPTAQKWGTPPRLPPLPGQAGFKSNKCLRRGRPVPPPGRLHSGRVG